MILINHIRSLHRYIENFPNFLISFNMKAKILNMVYTAQCFTSLTPSSAPLPSTHSVVFSLSLLHLFRQAKDLLFHDFTHPLPFLCKILPSDSKTWLTSLSPSSTCSNVTFSMVSKSFKDTFSCIRVIRQRTIVRWISLWLTEE